MSMLDSEDRRRSAELLIITLAKLFVVLELSPEACPLCRSLLTHDDDCPILLSWSLLDEEQQRDARTAIRALALSLGYDDAFSDTVTH